MHKRYLRPGFSSLLLLVTCLHINSQNLVKLGAVSTSNYDAVAEWGDYDNDGDLDILYVKNPDYDNGRVAVWRNNGSGSFTSVDLGIPFVGLVDVNWCDYDNDGDLDLTVTGTDTERVSNLYKNNGSGVFSEVNAGLKDLSKARFAWGDYNNDGRPDLYLTGLDENLTPLAILYRNNGDDVFAETDIEIRTSVEGIIEWADYNNDDYLDLLIHGNDFNGNLITDIYKNTGEEEFVPLHVDFMNVSRTDMASGDYDGDGDLDIAFSGYSSTFFPNKPINLYRNDGNEQFTEIDHGLSLDLSLYPIDWGDSDNDGDLDLLTNGNGGGEFTHLVKNQGGDVFQMTNSTISKFSLNATGEWGDFDNDRDLDMIVVGWDSELVIFRNDVTATNSAPSSPTGLTSDVGFNEVRLSWNAASDNSTPSQALTYNIRIGSSPGSGDIVSGMAVYPSGFRRVADIGNAGHGTSFIIKDLPAGTYYWTVQSIDASYTGSVFSSVQSFEVLPTIELASQVFPVGSDYGLAWGDYNNDGYMDLAMLEYEYSGGSRFYPRLYKNNGDNTFSLVNRTFTELKSPTLSWADFDNDMDLDLLHCGTTPGTGHLRAYLYRNEGNDQFVNPYVGLDTIGATNFADLDNDGDLDLVIGSAFFENDQNTYTRKLTFKDAVILDIGDYDNDMDLDLMMNLDDTTRIMANEGSWNFSDAKLSLPSLWGKIIFNEFDNDGDLDIMYAGNANGLNSAAILRNDEGVFTDAESKLRGVWAAYANAGDYNNDGYTDLFYTGLSGDWISKVYLNNKDYTFTDLHLNFPVTGSNNVSQADVDNDGDLDFFVTDYSGSSKLYINNMNVPLELPDKPGDLQWENFGKGIKISWTRPANMPEGESGLTYNIRIGTSPGAYDIVSPMSVSPGSQERLLPQKGNAELNTSWRLESLPLGDYYWSVQAITPSYHGGEWSEESIFTVSSMRPFFSFDTVCVGYPSSFTDKTIVSGTSIASWQWDFGDGNSSTSQNPQHEYDVAGTYTVTLTVKDASNASQVRMEQVTVLPKPIARFTVSDVCIGNLASLSNTSVTDTLLIDSWSWDYGDGSESTLQHPAPYGYLNAGGYDLKLRVVALNGCSDSVENRIEVAEYPNANIGVAIGYTPKFCEGGEVKLEVAKNSNYNYQWRIDGGMISGADSSVFTTSTSGEYTVVVTNQTAGCSSESDATMNVEVVPSPSAPFIQSSGLLTFCEGDSAILSVTDIPGNSYQWKLNGGAVGSNMSSYVAKAEGSFTVDVSNETGCIVESSNAVSLTVIPAPVSPTLKLSGATSFCEDDSLTLSIAEPGSDSYQWLNELGDITGEIGTSITITETGSYQVRVSDGGLCDNYSQEVNVTVNPYPSVPTILTENYEEDGCQNEAPITLKVGAIEEGISYQWKRNGIALDGETDSELSGYLEEVDYSVEAINNTCVAESDVLTISYADMPDKPVIYTEGPVVWYLACSNIEASEYRWYLDGNRIEGADDYLHVAGTVEGRYEVSISEEGSCFAKSNPVWIPLGSATGIDQDIWKDLKIYPNPTPGLFTLEMDNDLVGELVINIFDESGKQILNIKFFKETNLFRTAIDLGGQPAGAYIVGILIDQYNISKTMLVN